MLEGGQSYLLNEVELFVSNEVYEHYPPAQPLLASLKAVECRQPSLVLTVHEGLQGVGYHDRLIELAWFKDGQNKPVSFEVDYSQTISSIKSFPAPKQGAFNQALGRKSKVILDVTGGWGGDAMLMATQGYRVTVIERNPLMALMMHEAFARAHAFVLRSGIQLKIPTVILADSISAVSSYAEDIDCAYVDPMFPPKRKKSAAVNKKMQLLQWLIGEDSDASDLLASVIDAGITRVAVKRPSYAVPLLKKPEQQFSSKLVHYDVYLNK